MTPSTHDEEAAIDFDGGSCNAAPIGLSPAWIDLTLAERPHDRRLYTRRSPISSRGIRCDFRSGRIQVGRQKDRGHKLHCQVSFHGEANGSEAFLGLAIAASGLTCLDAHQFCHPLLLQCFRTTIEHVNPSLGVNAKRDIKPGGRCVRARMLSPHIGLACRSFGVRHSGFPRRQAQQYSRVSSSGDIPQTLALICTADDARR